ncbi:MAG: imidazole glycerol phosphate synthase subunit HisH, partial [Deltaproteobacteria bacterium]
MITLLDYGAGNVRSVINAIESLGESVKIVRRGDDILSAERLIFPGEGAFGAMMEILEEKRFLAPLTQYLTEGRPFFGICLGMHALFESSEEAPGVPGLGIFKGIVQRFKVDLAVPHIGWNGIQIRQPCQIFKGLCGNEKFYFVHSFHVVPQDPEVVLTTTDYDTTFVSAVQSGAIIGTQFHPEKSGTTGLRLLENFIH